MISKRNWTDDKGMWGLLVCRDCKHVWTPMCEHGQMKWDDIKECPGCDKPTGVSFFLHLFDTDEPFNHSHLDAITGAMASLDVDEWEKD